MSTEQKECTDKVGVIQAVIQNDVLTINGKSIDLKILKSILECPYLSKDVHNDISLIHATFLELVCLSVENDPLRTAKMIEPVQGKFVDVRFFSEMMAKLVV